MDITPEETKQRIEFEAWYHSASLAFSATRFGYYELAFAAWKAGRSTPLVPNGISDDVQQNMTANAVVSGAVGIQSTES